MSTNADAPDRALQLALARTAYNYMRSYPDLDAIPLCAGLPPGEEFTPAYNALVLRSAAQIAENFLSVARRILAEELDQDSHVLRLGKLLEDIEKAAKGFAQVSAEGLAGGPTAFLKSTLFDLLRTPVEGKWEGDRDFLQATSEADYVRLIDTLPTPLMLDVEAKAWMPTPEHRALYCQQDWFFGYLQVAGFNTTNLRGVVPDPKPGDAAVPGKAVTLGALKARMSITDALFRAVLGDPAQTLDAAVASGKLYVCDYTALIGDGNLLEKESSLHGKHRYLPAPIAVFYWNEQPPKGYPAGYRGDGSQGDGALQPIAIQLTPGKADTLFTPNDVSGGNDPELQKWKIAKFFVNVACAIQHESVAHLGECHFIIESIAVAVHRQLAEQHPLYRLLQPHLRFTLSINSGALGNLIIPGGVVASNVGPNIHWTLQMVNEARKAWRWDENSPERIFALRGVDVDRPLAFPFRDDTLLLWQAIQGFVRRYVNHHYASDGAVVADLELGAWLDELTSARGADFKGLARPTTREALASMLAQIVYIAGPQHAAVNYAQYPLGAYMPSVAATIYHKAPTSHDTVDGKKDYLKWLPPLDVALYTLSFEYLLSSVQYDVFGHYASNPQERYFAERELQEALEDFQDELARAEAEIHRRNRNRPMPYPFQLPSRIPNSISI